MADRHCCVWYKPTHRDRNTDSQGETSSREFQCDQIGQFLGGWQKILGILFYAPQTLSPFEVCLLYRNYIFSAKLFCLLLYDHFILYSIPI
jgi:hypothetical protein